MAAGGGNCSRLGEPFPVEKAFGPPGEIHAVVAPLDALSAVWCDDFNATGRAADRRGGLQCRAGSRPRRGRRTNSALPDENPQGVRPLDVGELDIGPRGKSLVVLECAAEPFEAVELWQRPKNDALRVSHIEDDGLNRFVCRGNGRLLEI